VKHLSPDALIVLGSLEIADDGMIRLPEQLPRRLYAEVNTALTAIGYVWRRHVKCHVPMAEVPDPRGALDQILNTGVLVDARQNLGFFETPDDIVTKLVDECGLRRGDGPLRVLEPSAGCGAILRQIPRFNHVTAVEIDAGRAALLPRCGIPVLHVMCADFLALPAPAPEEEAFDRVIMNPPFGRQADIEHVTHALGFLKPGGKLAAIMAAGLLFRENRKTHEFHTLLAPHDHDITELPDHAFRPSGTDVRTVILTLEKSNAAV